MTPREAETRTSDHNLKLAGRALVEVMAAHGGSSGIYPHEVHIQCMDSKTRKTSVTTLLFLKKVCPFYKNENGVIQGLRR
ncbi:hypothetical protein Y1Q_0021027 [Alligator mississippiensis]|uniref:Uncharacterized protein n=1 Tax=Alligator mississippiensis TaxID=8496 RepID=A0A151M5G1_ALLMI|nr:hypothetical protein Y1Q_0021027 [Alligator mississippiensis]